MTAAKFVTFELRNGEKRVYKDVTQVDDSRRHLVLVYSNNVLIAQLNKHDVVRFTFEKPSPVAAASAPAAEEATEATAPS
jgi:hypothetical protein